MKEIEKRIKYYLDFSGLDDKTFKKACLKYPTILELNSETILNKVKFFENLLNVDKKDYGKMFKRSPAIFTYSEQHILNSIKFIQNTFKLSNQEIKHVIINAPALLGYDVKEIDNKKSFYKDLLNLSAFDFIKMITKYPNILCFKKENILEKIESLKNSFKVDNKEITKLIKNSYLVLTLDKNSVLKKKALLNKLGVDDEFIKLNFIIFSAPLEKLENKFKLFAIVNRGFDFVKSNWFVQSFDLDWAKYQFLKKNYPEFLNYKILIKQNGRFENKFKISKEELLKLYPFKNEDIEFINKEFDKINNKIETNRENNFIA